MKICIYCKKCEKETIFSTKRGDEVIPQFLGKFAWFFGPDVVCKDCNNKLSKTENLFKEGSLAGIHSAVYGVDNESASIRVRKDRVNWTISSDMGRIGMFKNVFPFVKLTDNNACPKSIVILDHKDSKIKYILFVEKYSLFARNQKTKNFQDRKKAIEKLRERFKKLDIKLFGDTKKGWTIERITKLLKTYGLDYKEKSQENFEDADRGIKWNIDYVEDFDAETLKTPVKIAFNYFAFCAKKDGIISILLNSVFDHVRNYLNTGKLLPIDYKPSFTFNSRTKDKRGFHIISFQKEGNFITGLVSLFGRFNYKIVLAEYPFKIQSKNFGCATAFDPFSEKIITSLYSSPLPNIGKPDYGLFCR